MQPLAISSRDNPLLVQLRRLAADPAGYRKLGMIWLEGEHLCQAALARGRLPQRALVSQTGWDDGATRELASAAPAVAVLPDAVFKALGTLESPARIGFVLALSTLAAEVQGGLPSLVLDRLQDAGNVGTVLRSAAAFGVRQVVALKGTAALWSPKVLRAGMGAHFSLQLVESATLEDLGALKVPLVATSLRSDKLLHQTPLPQPCAWVFGHEGQGVDAALAARCELALRIAQPGGEESLNVAAAAAICLYEQSRRQVA